MTMTMGQGIRVSEVTDVDRRTARRLGMDAEKVNLVINTWASEYLNYERENARMTTVITGQDVTTPKPAKTPAKRAAAKAPAKPAKSRAAIGKESHTDEPASDSQANSEGQS